MVLARASAAQEEVIPVLRGEVRLGDLPLTDGTVVLHRVSSDFQGEIDSVQVAADGSFILRLPYLPDHEARGEIFFASVRFRGILYFGPAVTDPIHLDSLYVIPVFDTVAAPVGGAPLPVGTRNLFLESQDGGWRATDVFQILNEGDRTVFSPSEEEVWSYPLPLGIRDFEVGQSDLPGDAIRLDGGEVGMYAPMPPGERILLVRYSITREEFEIPLPGRTDRLEVLLREPGPEATFEPLALEDPVELEPGQVFRRYAGTDLRDQAVWARFELPGWKPRAEWLGVLLAALLAGLGVFAYRRSLVGRRAGATRPESRRREAVLLAIAELDEEFESLEDPSERSRAHYRSRRNELLRELRRMSV